MSKLKIMIPAIALILTLSSFAGAQPMGIGGTATPTVLLQSDANSFRSGGGFKIGLPKSFSKKQENKFDGGNVVGRGMSYTWEKPDEYSFEVIYYKLDNGKESLSEADKASYLEAYKQHLLRDLLAAKLPFIDNKYAFNGNNGGEIQAINSARSSKMLVRFFIAGQRFYFIGLVFNVKKFDDSEIAEVADSFALLDSESLIEAKIEEAMPEAPPQEPVAAKRTTDAQDNNLRGKVKSVIEDNQNDANERFRRLSEQYYDEKGNLVKEMDFDEGYPDSISLWGFIDGKRITRVGSIEFDMDQRPPPEGIRAIMIEKESTLPKDSRFDFRYEYKYNAAGQLTERTTFRNNGRILVRTVYKYKENQREELNYGADGRQWSQTIEILDKNGNVVERNLMDEKGKIGDRQINTYEFDTNGNWIVQKSFEKKAVKGKEVLEPLWTSRRTITYYP